MLIAQADPVLVLAMAAAVFALVACHILAFLTLHRSRKLLIRILDTTSKLSVAVSRLEQVRQAGNASSNELRKIAGTVSRAISGGGVDIDGLL